MGMLNLIGLHRHPDAYHSPNSFAPDRWDAEIGAGYFSPFTFGRRQCLGKSFFWLEAKAILSAILGRYELRGGRVPDWSTLQISTQPAEPVLVTLIPRQ